MSHGEYCIDEQFGLPACGDPAGHESWSTSHEDFWKPAGNGSETPFSRDGRTYLYVYNRHTRKHGFLDLVTDIVIDDRDFYGV